MSGRPSKYNEATVGRLLEAISQGYTMDVSCQYAGITSMTVGRWRKSYPEFETAFVKATEQQWQNIEFLAKRGIRTYRRKTHKIPSLLEKSHTSGFRASQGHSGTTNHTRFGLPVRAGSVFEDMPFTPAISPTGDFVEFLKADSSGNYIHHRVHINAYLRRLEKLEMPVAGVVIQ